MSFSGLHMVYYCSATRNNRSVLDRVGSHRSIFLVSALSLDRNVPNTAQTCDFIRVCRHVGPLLSSHRSHVRDVTSLRHEITFELCRIHVHWCPIRMGSQNRITCQDFSIETDGEFSTSYGRIHIGVGDPFLFETLRLSAVPLNRKARSNGVDLGTLVPGSHPQRLPTCMAYIRNTSDSFRRSCVCREYQRLRYSSYLSQSILTVSDTDRILDEVRYLGFVHGTILLVSVNLILFPILDQFFSDGGIRCRIRC